MKDKTRHWILIGSFAFVLIALTAVSALFAGRKADPAPEPPVSEEQPLITPEPTTGEDAIVVRTPVPTRAAETPVPVFPRGAVNLLVNGSPLFALDNHAIAEQLVRQYLEECAYENLDAESALLTAAIDAELMTVPADGSVEYLTAEAAMNRLRKNRSLIPVRRTVESAAVLSEIPEPVSETTRVLPKGARMFRRFGVPSRTLVLTETLYRDGLAVSRTEILNMPVQTGIAQSVLIGTHFLSLPDPSDANALLYPYEGTRGPMPETLSFQCPIRGELVFVYGIATGTMHYGVDYAAAPGTPIVAPEDGTVVFLGERPGLGFVIEIAHEEGFVSRVSFGADTTVDGLTLGRHVEKGDTLALLPESDTDQAPRLHFELLLNGLPYNPLFYLPA